MPNMRIGFRHIPLCVASGGCVILLISLTLLQPSPGSRDVFVAFPRENAPQSGSARLQKLHECMRETSRYLPFDKHLQLKAHHGSTQANTGFQKGRLRFSKLDGKLSSESVVWELGGHIEAKDSRVLNGKFRPKIRIFEPVGEFCEQLEKNWLGDDNAQVHCFGLGNFSRTLRIQTSSLQGESTFVMDASGAAESTASLTDVVIREVASVFEELLPEEGRVDLLHVNCEGCEWETMRALIEKNLISRIGIISINFHAYGLSPDRSVWDLLEDYCVFKMGAEKTHDHMFGFPFGWERWEPKQVETA